MRASRLLLIRTIILFLAAMLAAPAAAQNHITAQLVAEGPAQPGGEVEVAIVMTPEPGWHGYWLNPGDAGVGMMLDWTLPDGWKAGAPQYPVPHRLLVSGLMNHVYAGPYAVLVPLTLPLNLPPDRSGSGVVPITLQADWLACTDEICVPERGTMAASITLGKGQAASPVRDPRFDAWHAAIPPLIDSKAAFALFDNRVRIGIPLPASFAIGDAHLFLETEDLIHYAAPQKFWRDGDVLIAELARREGSAAPAEIAGIIKLDDAGNGVRFVADPGAVPLGGKPLDIASGTHATPGLWGLLLAALAGGLLLNIMPCVFPILSLKALSLARAGESEAEARAEGVAYTGGVMLATVALGALMLALRAAGDEIGWAFQLQEPWVVVALLLLASAITANLAGLFELPSLSITRGGKPMGAFATGLLAAFVATPCTGPFMAVAMGAALLLPPLWALLLFAVLGLGIALPFLALGFVPPLRRMLPRPGTWMETFRKILAVPMGLTALALAWLCWRLGGAQFGLLALVLVLALAVLLAMAGKRQRAGETSGIALTGGLPALLIFALVTMPAAFQPEKPAAEKGLIAAQVFSEAALARARASGKPVFLWFTADWCLTCKVNESVAIEREETRAAFEKAGVIAMSGDWTRRDAEITRFLTAQGAAGVPLYLWYPAGGEAAQLPQLLTPDSLIELASAE